MTRTPGLARITVYPVKPLPGYSPDRARLVDGGALEHDREFAVVDADGEYVDGKRTDAVHGLDASFDPGADRLGFRERFVEKREGTFPEWADDDRFEGPFSLTVHTAAPPAAVGAAASVGDPVRVGTTRPACGSHTPPSA